MMFPDYEAQIITNMIRKKYRVQSSTAGGKISHQNKNTPGCLLIITVDNGVEKTTADNVLIDFCMALREAKAKYYSAIVSTVSDAVVFDLGNIVLPEEVMEPSQPVME